MLLTWAFFVLEQSLERVAQKNNRPARGQEEQTQAASVHRALRDKDDVSSGPQHFVDPNDVYVRCAELPEANNLLHERLRPRLGQASW